MRILRERYGGEAGQSGPYAEPLVESLDVFVSNHYAIAVPVRLANGESPRSYQAHLALPDTQQLRQLIQSHASEHQTDPSHARVGRRRLHLPELFIRARHHRAELAHSNDSSITAPAIVLIKNGTAVIQF